MSVDAAFLAFSLVAVFVLAALITRNLFRSTGAWLLTSWYVVLLFVNVFGVASYFAP